MDNNNLEMALRASLYQQYVIRLVNALIKYGAHTPECSGINCSCGWDANQIESLIQQAKQLSLPVSKN